MEPRLMTSFKLRGAAIVASAALSLFAPQANAGTLIGFDANGGGDNFQQITTLDNENGNALSINSVPIRAIGQTFTTVYQGRLGTLTGGPGAGAPTGLGVDYEITLVVSIVEEVTNFAQFATSGFAEFSPSANQAGSFIEIYYRPLTGVGALTASDDLAGTNFDNGQLILRATPNNSTPNSGGYNSRFNQITTFDQHNGDDYNGFQTVTGSGTTDFNGTVTFFDDNFFDFGDQLVTVVGSFNTSLVTPFQEVDPSRQFFGGNHASITPNLGAINGLNGPDFQFQTDANLSFVVTSVPEPGTIATAVLGLGLTGLVARRRRKS